LENISQNESIACDGTYLYVHTFKKGLRKVGTGHGGTIAGHVYETNTIYRPTDKLKSLAYVNSKLFYLAPKTSSMLEQRAEGASVELEEDDDIEEEDEEVDQEIDNEEPSEQLQIAIIDVNTLKVVLDSFEGLTFLGGKSAHNNTE
jgi:hypothetical protein